MPSKRQQISPSSTTGVPPIPKSPASSSSLPASSSSPSSIPQHSKSGSITSSTGGKTGGGSGSGSPQEVLQTLWKNYNQKTAQRTKLVDCFMGFLVVLGGLQFLYCLIVGNYPFNAFLAGFSATVGQFVLTASLRIQTNPENEKEFKGNVSPERAFADFVVGSLILHFFCINFIN